MAENSLTGQVSNFFGRLSLFQKILFIGVPSVILIGLIVLFSVANTNSDYKVLFNELAPSDAGKITQALDEKQIKYKLEDGGTTILVPQERLYSTRIDLASEGLPESSVVGYELFDDTNLGMSEFVQQVNFKRALEGEIARTIGSMDEVKKVRVHLVIPETKLFAKDQNDPTASITLHLKSGRSLSSVSIEGMQTLVASSVEGMLPENVTIVNHLGRLLSKQPIDENSIAGKTAQQLEQQRRVESHLSGKIQSMLDGVLGVNNSTVEVTADLNFTSIEQTKTDYDPERQVIRSEQAIQEATESTDSLSYPAVNIAKDKSNIIQNYEISKNVEHIIHSVGSVNRLSVAVMINGTTKVNENPEGLKEVQYVPRTEEEMQKLEEIVKNAVGYTPERGDQVSVINVPFDTMIDYEIVEQDNLQWWQTPENQRLIALLALMLITIFVMYRMLQSQKIKERLRIAMNLPAKIDVDEDELEDEEEEEEEELEDLDLDEEDLLLLPAELPEQLLLEGDVPETNLEEDVEQDEVEDERSFKDEALSRLGEDNEQAITEDSLMKQEMKEKIEEFVDDKTDEAVKIIRAVLAQDIDLKNF